METITNLLRPTTVFPKYWRGGAYIRGVSDPDELRPEVLEIALRTAEAAACALRLPPVITVQFYRPCAPDHPDASGPFTPIPRGICRTTCTDEIWIHAGLTPTQTERTVAHEMRHVWQILNAVAEGDRPARELDASQFAAAWMTGIA